MLDFSLSEEHQAVEKTVRDWAAREVAPKIHDLDREHRFERSFLKGMAELQLLGICIPEEYGGAGSILAAGCDIVLAGASARFGHPEIKGGVFNPVAAALLPRLVGRKKAFEMILGGGLLTAAEAEKIGLVSRVLPDERLEADAAAFIQRFREGSAPILQLTRRAVAGGLDLLFPDALRHAEDVYLNQLMATEDAEEGLKAVMAKRKPAWKDK